MPIKRIFWSGASNQDIHVLRGQTTRDLTRTGLRFVQQDESTISAADYLGANHDVVLKFQPLFKGAPSGNVFAGMGITVDQRTGQVTVEALPRPLPKNNFIIEITATDPAHNVVGTERIRIHIHTSVTSVALTPRTLTVRPAAATRSNPERTQYRFTLRARFDDGTMGDLTDNHDVAWSSSPPDRIDPDFFQLIVAPGDAVNDTITITATLPPALGGASTTATMRVGTPWHDESNLPRAAIVPGGGWPGTTLPDRAPNVLFLGDGYTFADEPSFDRTVTTIVHHLKTDRLVRPFDLLCTSMNFWRLFVPAEARGISFRGEVYTVVDSAADQTFVGYVLVPPQKPPPTGRWGLSHLFYAVGLPVPTDAGKSPDDLRGDWAALLDVPPTRAQVSDDLIKEWKRNATRIFVDELDDFPGMAYGSPPAANDAPGIRDLTLHPFRATRTGIDHLVAEVQSADNVQLGPGLNVGAIWATPAPRFDDTDYAVKDLIRAAGNVFVCTGAGTSAASQPADYASAREGQSVTDGTATFLRLSFDNFRFVVVFNAFPAGRALNTGLYIAASTRTGPATLALKQVSPGRFVLNMQEVPSTVAIDTCRTIAHELGHSLNLDDEYAEFKDTFTGGANALARIGNLQSEAETKNAAGQIDGANIKWNWHRARKAAVLRDAISEIAADTYRIPVVAGQASQFRKDETVLLRLRVPGQALASANTVTVSKALQIAVAPSAAAAADYLVVQPAAGVTVSPADMQMFTAGSIVFATVPAPALADDPEPFARLVAKNVKRLITSRHAPLYRRPADPLTEEERQHPNLDGLSPGLPGRPFCFKVKHKIVGLYEGGNQFTTGIFHPTGSCVMRDAHVDTSEFCAVCRYVMVDLVDPSRHFEIDRDYDDIYPLR